MIMISGFDPPYFWKDIGKTRRTMRKSAAETARERAGGEKLQNFSIVRTDPLFFVSQTKAMRPALSQLDSNISKLGAVEMA